VGRAALKVAGYSPRHESRPCLAARSREVWPRGEHARLPMALGPSILFLFQQTHYKYYQDLYPACWVKPRLLFLLLKFIFLLLILLLSPLFLPPSSLHT